ncbi:MAG: ribosome small subunit-dependent GTPase A, partial [Micrococcales bacterium]|nr:ribosome small subunit-dependent GTPase A [Micrococcales bacterium]
DPPPRPRLIDRCLVAAYDAGLDAVVCLTKADLEDDGELRALYEPLGVRVVATSVVGGGAGESATQGTPSCDMGDGGGAGESATQGTPSCDRGDGGSAWEGRIEGVNEVRGLLAGRVSVLVGHSGVGKSTLVNALVPGAERAVGEVNLVTGRGRHTSTQVVALPLPGGGWIIDTPGIRSFGLGHVRDEHILAAFEDVAAAAEDCPRGCTHAADAPDCFLDEWVEEAGEAGRRPRLDSFRRLMESRAEEKVGR